jgi:pilus assembly protein CpaF
MQDIFVFEKQGVDQEGKVNGVFRSTGVRPKFVDILLAAGIQLDTAMFSNRRS